ncbi:MAG: hypothetical protein HGA51_07580 [Demequinaceae bacterium]|nr:hypothetical protein [Demequinaceae bacterium]
MTRRFARLAVTAVAVLALAGCVRFTSVNSFSADDTVTQDLVVALTADAASQVGIDLSNLTAAALTSASAEAFPGVDPTKVTIEDYTEGDRKGVHIVARDLTLDEFNAAATEGSSAITNGIGTPMTVTREGDTYIVTVPADPARDLSQVQGGGSLGLISSSVDFSITMEFPGPVKSATAGQVDGKKVVLGLEDLFTPDAIVIKAQATPGIAWGPILRWLGIGAIAIVIVGGATFLIWQDKRKQRINNLPPIGGTAGTEPDAPEAPDMPEAPTP